MFQLGPAYAENLLQQHLRHPEHATCDRQPFFLTKEVNPIIKNQAICMPGKIQKKYPIMSPLKDIILKKDDIILYGACPRIA
jgi:hypothetical protein